MGSMSTYSTPKWWKESVVYQVYPSSFQSHKGATSGWGTVKGITSRVDYLKSLGIDILWTSPIYKSPQADMGYDIADYKQIDPIYGSVDDVDELIAELKKRDMRLVMDLVVNHTSNMHEWFLESRSSKTNPKRDWYIWRDPKSVSEGGVPEPPNNWAQILGEANSAWTYDTETGQYYLSIFTPEQPDLNWENPEVRNAVWDVMHFWLKRGVAGFRMDVINMIAKNPAYPDAPAVLGAGHKYQPATQFFTAEPNLYVWLSEMNKEVLSKYEHAFTVGEMPKVEDENKILDVVGANAGRLNMIFIFSLVDIDFGAVRMEVKPWTVTEMKSIISKWQRTMIENSGWNSVFIENHDNPRSVSRYTDDSDEFRDKGAKLLALMQTTLGGTLFVYQGEEIGVRNASLEWSPEEYKDIETVNYWKKCQQLYKNDPKRLEEGRRVIQMKARDHARTPMQWNDSENAGFCDAGVQPWMRVMDDWKTINAEAQMKAKDANEFSTWQFWQRALHDRKKHADAFIYGDFKELNTDNPAVYGYVRTSQSGERWLVVLNFSGKEQQWDVPSGYEVEEWVCDTYSKYKADKPGHGSISLEPWQGVLGHCKV